MNKKDPGVDNPDIHVHPELYIEDGILPYIKKLWANGIKTFESGEDILLDEQEEYVDDSLGPITRLYKKKGKYREKAFLIILKKDFEKAKQFLPKNIEWEIGTGGFCPNEYQTKVPKDNQLMFIVWKEK